MSSRPTHTREQKTFERLMISIVELIWVGLRYIGITSKDALDQLIDLSHPSTPNSSKSRRIERIAIMRYVRDIWYDEFDEGKGKSSKDKSNRKIQQYNDIEIEMEDKEVGYYDYNEDNLGDSFPHISHLKSHLKR